MTSGTHSLCPPSLHTPHPPVWGKKHKNIEKGKEQEKKRGKRRNIEVKEERNM